MNEISLLEPLMVVWFVVGFVVTAITGTLEKLPYQIKVWHVCILVLFLPSTIIFGSLFLLILGITHAFDFIIKSNQYEKFITFLNKPIYKTKESYVVYWVFHHEGGTNSIYVNAVNSVEARGIAAEKIRKLYGKDRKFTITGTEWDDVQRI